MVVVAEAAVDDPMVVADMEAVVEVVTRVDPSDATTARRRATSAVTVRLVARAVAMDLAAAEVAEAEAPATIAVVRDTLAEIAPR